MFLSTAYNEALISSFSFWKAQFLWLGPSHSANSLLDQQTCQFSTASTNLPILSSFLWAFALATLCFLFFVLPTFLISLGYLTGTLQSKFLHCSQAAMGSRLFIFFQATTLQMNWLDVVRCFNRLFFSQPLWLYLSYFFVSFLKLGAYC